MTQHHEEMHCPDCHRPTYYVSQMDRVGASGRNAKAPREGMIQAIRIDGTCTTCCRHQKGLFGVPKGQLGFVHGNKGRHRLTEEELTALRDKITIMEIDRLNRGVGTEGVPADDWAVGNGGLYSWQVK